MSTPLAWFLAAVMSIFGSVSSSDEPKFTPQQLEVTKVSQAWLDAFNHRDLETFARYIADDYIGSTDDGILITKARAVKWLSTRPPEYEQRKDLHDVVATVDGDTAIVNYLVESLHGWGDTTIVVHLRRTEVFRKRNGMWLVIATHESALPVSYRKAVTVDAKTFKDYTGKYDWPRHLVQDRDTVTVENGKLLSEWRGAKRECFPIGKDTFSARDDLGWWTFVRDAQGQVTSYVYYYPDGQEITAKKIE